MVSSLPFQLDESGNVTDIDIKNHCFVWIKVVTSPLVLTNVVEIILDQNPLLTKHLSGATDSVGRSALGHN